MKTRRIVGFAVLLMLLGAGTAVGQAGGKKYSENINRSLFSDRRAYMVGDVVTVLIIERVVGSHEAGTLTDKQNEMGASAVGSGDLASSLNMGVDAQWKNKHDGTGETRRAGTLEGTISARIMEITETGNLVIEGTREVVINGEKQLTTLRGVVRPEDISGQNTVYSFNIADAKISYTGKGDVNNGSKPGFFTKILNLIF
jgi:flagellar L-ring protein precursor FlgH